MFADVTTLHCTVLDAPELAAAAAAATAALPAGRLHGSWYTENGTLGRVVVVRTFDDVADLVADHRRQFLAPSPFGLGARVQAFTMQAHEVFDFAEILPPGRHGDIYELRVYELTMGGLEPTLAGWRAALPGRMPRSPLAIGMSALDGRPAITHVYPFAGSDARIATRAGLYRDGLWPPVGGPAAIAHGTSTILIPAQGSPWH